MECTKKFTYICGVNQINNKSKSNPMTNQMTFQRTSKVQVEETIQLPYFAKKEGIWKEYFAILEPDNVCEVTICDTYSRIACRTNPSEALSPENEAISSDEFYQAFELAMKNIIKKSLISI